MANYKLASREAFRFQTSKGSLSVEQLWQLSISELDALAVSLDEAHETSARKSFVRKSSAKDRILKAKFEIVLDVLNTKMEEEEVAKQKLEDKEHNEKILKAIAEKQDESLKGKSLKQLEAMLR